MLGILKKCSGWDDCIVKSGTNALLKSEVFLL